VVALAFAGAGEAGGEAAAEGFGGLRRAVSGLGGGGGRFGFGGGRDVAEQVLPFSAGMLAASTSAFSAFSFDLEPVVEAVTLDNLRGTSVLEAPEDLAAYANTFDLLRSAALTPDESAQLIREILRTTKEVA
jgi:hypothetical protein